MSKVLVFTRFERFWHWTQALLILILLVTGFDLHGSYDLLSFRTASLVHVVCAFALIALWIFAIFWHMTTGEWRQYIPTTRRLSAMVLYYAVGIFTGAPHPVKKTRAQKHNPLQRLAYLFFKLVISPAIWVSGLAYLAYAITPEGVGNIPLEPIALLHTAAAYAMAVFLIVHAYMATTGPSVLAYLKGMITGYEEVADEEPPARP